MRQRCGWRLGSLLESLDIDGCIITTEGFGNNHIDFIQHIGQAGKRAGMITLVAGFGYLSDADRPREWAADGFLEQPGDLLAWLERTA